MKSSQQKPRSKPWIALLVRLSLFAAIIAGIQMPPAAAAARSASFYQTLTVSGKVVAAPNNEGLPGVNIVIKGTSMGTVTDANGEYHLEVPSRESVLIFTSIGFNTREITVGDKSL